MRTLRLVLTLLFVLVLPINGIAGLLLPSEPCPMPMPQMSAHGKGCCDDSGAKLSKSCKSGQECKTASLLRTLTSRPDLPAPLALPAPLTDAPLLSSAPSGVWRPPRS